MLDYPEVVIEAQKALYNIILTYSNNCTKLSLDFNKILEDVVVTLENQLDLLNNEYLILSKLTRQYLLY